MRATSLGHPYSCFRTCASKLAARRAATCVANVMAPAMLLPGRRAPLAYVDPGLLASCANSRQRSLGARCLGHGPRNPGLATSLARALGARSIPNTKPVASATLNFNRVARSNKVDPQCAQEQKDYMSMKYDRSTPLTGGGSSQELKALTELTG